MSSVTLRPPILPRDVAAAVIVDAVSRAAWAISALVLLLTIPALAEAYLRAGIGASIAAPIVVILVMLGFVVLRAARPTRGVSLLAVTGIAAGLAAFLFLVLAGHPNLQATAGYMVNRPAIVLVLAGTVSARPLRAVGGGIVGFFAAVTVTATIARSFGVPFVFDFGLLIVFANYCVAFVAIWFIQYSQRRTIPDFGRLQWETRRREAERTREGRAIALIHDTLLNDLALIINGPERLDTRAQARLRKDIATLSSGAGLRTPLRAQLDPDNAQFRNSIISIVSELQWRGLTVELTGNHADALNITPEAAVASLGAVRACLENVLAHSGVTTAEVVLGKSEDAVTIMVIDAGVGFRPESVASDRLGLRTSIGQRVEEAGGTVRVWSTPGRGTSVLISIPMVRSNAEEPNHA